MTPYKSTTTFPPIPLFLILILILPNAKTQQDHEQQQFQAFAEHLGQFNPTQTFEFDLQPTQQQTLIFWPPSQAKFIRGMFYITSENNNGLFVGVQHLDELKKTFWDKKIGVFNVGYSGVGDIKIIFKSQIKKLTVYLSYQLAMPKPTKTPPPTQPSSPSASPSASSSSPQPQQSQLSPLLSKYNKIKSSLTVQQQILKSIITASIRQSQKLRSEIESKSTRVMIETIILFISGIVSIIMLRRQFRKGYQLVI